MSSVHNAYAGTFSISSVVLMTTFILYMIFLPGIAVGQEWAEYSNWDFKFNYPTFLYVYEVDNGVQLFLKSEEGSEKTSFVYNAYAYQYDGHARTLDELANEIAFSIDQGTPNAQINSAYVKGNIAIVEYAYDDTRAIRAATLSEGNLYLYGYDFVMGLNDSQYIYTGSSIMNSMKILRLTLNDLEDAQNAANSWREQLRISGEMLDMQIQEENEQRRTPGTDTFCLNNPDHVRC